MNVLNNLESAVVVHVEPGDVIWLTVRDGISVSSSMAEAIREQGQTLWPDNKVVVSQHVDVKVVRSEDDQ